MSSTRAAVALCASACFLVPQARAEAAADEHAAELQLLRQRVQALEEKIGADAPAQDSDAASQGDASPFDNIFFTGDARDRAESIGAGDLDNDRHRGSGLRHRLRSRRYVEPFASEALARRISVRIH
jgi:hypothetical protein